MLIILCISRLVVNQHFMTLVYGPPFSINNVGENVDVIAIFIVVYVRRMVNLNDQDFLKYRCPSLMSLNIFLQRFLQFTEFQDLLNIGSPLNIQFFIWIYSNLDLQIKIIKNVSFHKIQSMWYNYKDTPLALYRLKLV